MSVAGEQLALVGTPGQGRTAAVWCSVQPLPHRLGPPVPQLLRSGPPACLANTVQASLPFEAEKPARKSGLSASHH